VSSGDKSISRAIHPGNPLHGRRVLVLGKLGGLTRSEAGQLIRQQQGVLVDRLSETIDMVVVGAENPLVPDPVQQLPAALREAIDSGRVEVLAETELWERLGQVPAQPHVRQLYTPAMLADLLELPVHQIRRWLGLGLLRPSHVVHRLPYFDFQQVCLARQLAEWVQQGASPQRLRQQLIGLSRWSSGEPAASWGELPVKLDGKLLLMRSATGLVEAGGQLRIDFDDLEPEPADPDAAPAILSVLHPSRGSPAGSPELDGRGGNAPATYPAGHPLGLDDILQQVAEAEDVGDLSGAIHWVRVALAHHGPDAGLCFQLAELLCRTGELTAARERYYAALEIDETFLEARASLGCVLTELGEYELATAAFRGAIDQYPDYADAHFHLAELLDSQSQPQAAREHWGRFLELAPASPWADTARDRWERLSHDTLF
jgi:tetratricopeptide (TPR) repeat protein